MKRQLPDGMNEWQARPVLSRLADALNEGYSIFDFPKTVYDQLKNGQSILFPRLISGLYNTQFVVKDDVFNENKLQPGDQITAISGIRIPQLVDLLSGYAGGLQSFWAVDVYKNISVCLYLSNIRGPYQVNYLHGNKKCSMTLQALSYLQFQSNPVERASNMDASAASVDNSSLLPEKLRLPGDKYLHRKTRSFEKFPDPCSGILRTKPTAKLIIDLCKTVAAIRYREKNCRMISQTSLSG